LSPDKFAAIVSRTLSLSASKELRREGLAAGCMERALSKFTNRSRDCQKYKIRQGGLDCDASDFVVPNISTPTLRDGMLARRFSAPFFDPLAFRSREVLSVPSFFKSHSP
jgi:hypothetical protein